MNNQQIIEDVKRQINYNGNLNTCKMWVKLGRYVSTEAQPLAECRLWAKTGETGKGKNKKAVFALTLAHLFGIEQTQPIEKNLATN